MTITAYALDAFIGNNSTSPKLVTNKGGLLVLSPAGDCAVDYDPATKLCKGVLVEPAATNYVLQSAGGRPGFLWGGNTSTCVTSAEKDPMGGLEALQVTTTGHGGMNVQKTLSGLTIATVYTASMWIKGTAGQQQYFTMDSTGLAAMQKLITFTGAWQRAFHTYAASGTSAYIGFETYNRSGGAHLPHTTYHIWGGQYEPGTVATSHIPTLASVVTRNDDFLIMPPGASLNYSNSAGTWWAEIELRTPASPYRIVGYYEGSMTPISTNGSTQFINFWGAGSITSPPIASILGVHRIVTAYQANDAAMTVDGLPPNTTTSNPAPLLATPSTIYLGHQGAMPINGWLRKLTYRQRRISNAEMQTETA